MTEGLTGISPDVVVNESYRDQRITGQQRYATEISRRLGVGFFPTRPRGLWTRSTLLTWMWVQVVLPLLGRSDVVLSMTSRAPLWCRRQVVVVHDLFVLTNPEWYSRAYVWTHAPLLRAQIKRAERVVAVSQPVADQVARWREDQVVVAPNAPSQVFLTPDDGSASQTLADHGVTPGTYFLAVGSHDPRKNLARLAAAYAMLGPEERVAHPLVVVGGGAAIYRDEQIVWPEGTVMAGYVDDDELRRLYRDAGSVVFVSLAEGFGLPLVEASASGARSLLVSDIEVFRWICGDQARYVDPTSSRAIANGMRAEIAERSHAELDLSRFTWEASAGAVAEACGRPDHPAVDPQDRELPGPRTAVVLASAGRPALLGDALRTVAEQQGVVFDTVVSVPDDASLPDDRSLLDGVEVVVGTRGLAAQRNAGLDAIPEAEVVAFFDDDAVLRPDYLRRALDFLAAHSDVVGLTGRVLLDGAVTGEISRADTDAALTSSCAEPATGSWSRGRELYGCNFVVRLDRVPTLRFDARLPLYSWLEDHDFARRLMPFGPIAKVEDCVIVHRAAASGGRQSHVRLGYSQVMNPVYLHRKGSFPWWLVMHETVLRVGKNAVLSVIGGEACGWRRDRLRGNLMAAIDAARGRRTPERISHLT